ncbi:hypothetical protein JK358_37280 [Nocardia sp. 2]|uniref:DUF3592 domain-containing protein n=1 Tax=Nocardia acididurans TaxID=2802282 RepID=A0ABS1MJ40_9NOCA|nr:hypothetical protein [Nocardia acididurans]MBL1080065.1 hypothetical protein [Nocardia acididurans]
MLFLVLALSFDVPDAWAALNGDGRPGTWTMTEDHCRPGRCVVRGDFTPDDGGPARYSVNLSGRNFQPERIGSRYRAIDVGARDEVYVPGGGRVRSAIWIVAILLPLTVLWGICVVLALRTSRTAVVGPDR